MTDFILEVTSGMKAGARFVLSGGELVLGREAGETGLFGDDEMLSRRHARIFGDPRGLMIEDLGSMNGTFVNGTRITGPRPLATGDLIKLGGTTLALRTEREEPVDLPVVDATLPRPVEQIGSPSAVYPVPRLALPVSEAVLLHEGRRVPVGPGGVSIGRDADNDVVIGRELASRHHARLIPSEGRHYVVDLDSTNGTYLNGERLLNESRWLNTGDTIMVGAETLRFLVGGEVHPEISPAWDPTTTSIRFDGTRLTIGRDSANDVVLDSPNISRAHAEVVASDGRVEVRDLGSQNGTRLNGELVSLGVLAAGSEIGIGPYRLLFDGTFFLVRDDRGALRLDAHGISIAVKQKVILNAVTLSIAPGELVAIIGESGAGKTTLLKALAGVTTPSEGAVTVNGEPIRSRLTEIGYVPQEEIVHRRLTVRESLWYSARLRLPQDATDGEIEDAVGRVSDDLALSEHVDTRIDALSGGQRKRVGVATELLNRPGLLCLDEPTTGLDPGLETRLMEHLRSLAEVRARAVVVTTHATKNLSLADRVCVMGRGGELCFVGSTTDAKRFFQVDSYDEIYGKLDQQPAAEWRRQFEAGDKRLRTETAERLFGPAASSRGGPTPRAWPQVRVLAARYFRLFARDRRNIAILLLQVPLLALGMALLFRPNVFVRGHSTNSATQLLFIMVTATIWLGTLDSARELIKEKAIALREAAIGVREVSYVTSKLTVLFVLIALQVALLTVIVFAFRPLHESGAGYLLITVTLLLTGFVAVGMGLAISALVNTEDQATAFIPIAMIVQLLFAGALVTVKHMGAAVAALSTVVFARWSFAGLGAVAHMNDRIAADASFSRSNPYSHSFFSLPVLAACAILLAFLAVFVALAGLLLRRRRT